MMTTYQHYVQLKAEHPGSYARDLAKMMGISEAELIQARADEAQPLRADFPALLEALQSVGEIKSITRNEYAVHEQTGTFDHLHIGPHAGLVLNPRHLDLRFFLAQWHSVFSLQEQSARGERHSIQVFDRHGEAVIKIYATGHTDQAAWQQLITAFRQPEPAMLSVSQAPAPAFAEQIDAPLIEQEWREMTDVHQFFRLLSRHNISRQQAFAAVSDDLACRVDAGALAQLLTLAQDAGNEIMIFVGNRGCTQIFTGPVEKVEPMKGWLNIFNPRFTLHLQDKQIAESWITRKPTVDGHVTSLELFAADGTQIAQLYGQRSEGQPEQTLWRQQIESLKGSVMA
ncbi:hemin-degrading factor [Tatumella sp. JGM118]|uniref:Hemin-degrading factor n=1 Tax=Tatumella terrea TaxID=419007 RepID=A0ABW1VXI8_9GAMM|nr:ChuX/HutX family heme-like substrate-binding protein [Tatumella sp. JGM118]